MAKENTVYLYGYAERPPKFDVVELSDGTIYKGQVQLQAVRRSYVNHQMLLKGTLRYNNIIIYSKNKEFIEKYMMELEGHEMLMVKGTLCTLEVPKRYLCPHCNHEVLREGVDVYIDPIYIKRCEQNISPEDSRKLLDDADEISNSVKIMGTLCRDVDYYVHPETNKPVADFQIASNRIRRIVEDGAEKKTDYPWVKTFGSMATECAGALEMGSSVYIDGAIQTRTNISIELVCDYCGEIFEREGRAMEIVPYHIEYLENCNIPESERGFEEDGE